MTVHRIEIERIAEPERLVSTGPDPADPDWPETFEAAPAEDPYVVFWDDEAGTVSGDYPGLASIRERMNMPMPLVIGETGALREIRDPRHDPQDFLWALGRSMDDPGMPDVLRNAPRQGRRVSGPELAPGEEP